MQNVFKYILIAVAAGVVSYIGLTIYGEGTRTAAASMAESVQLTQAQADNMRCLKVFVTELKLLPHGGCYPNQVVASQ